MNQTRTTTAGGNPITQFLGVVAAGQTYKNLLYLFLAFPLGIVYYTILIFGFAMGLALSVLVVGLGILVVTVIGLRYIASFERSLANRLLDTDIGRPDDVEKSGDGIVATAKAYLRASSTWRGLGFVFLKFWLGILSFILLVSFLGTGLELLVLPVYPGGVFNVEVGGWVVAETFETTSQRLLAVPVGAVLSVVALHILNAFAGANASIAESLLGPKDAEVSQPSQVDRSS
jgi:hypothetical protein